ncbi:MAG: MarC family protein [Candidatus Methylarchaceae archaeon HK02M2]|nr:MarC family protein [Candidatus Methylarchaceae archaeon HK02M2]
MAGELEFLVLSITSIVSIMNPASTLAVYTVLTKDMKAEERHKIIVRSVTISFFVLSFFALTGQLLFTIFNITIASFKIAGGILMIVLALGMLSSKKREYSPDELEDFAIVPLTFPLTAGAGTITTVILLTSEANNLLLGSFIFIGIIVGVLLSYLGMKYSYRIIKLVSREGLRVIARLLSIIILAIAVQFIINGIMDVILPFL